MNHTSLSRALAVAGVVLLPAWSAWADASGLAFTINDRPGRVPAVKVRWSFALDAAPGVGTQVTIAHSTGGSASAALGGGWVNVTTASGTDRFRLDATTALANGVTFQYEARSHFALPDLCNLKVAPPLPTFPKAVTLDFTGPTITQHAIVTYTVAGNTAAGSLNCVTAKRRVNTAAAAVTSAPPGAVALSRHPLDVVLVLDKSGSMGWELPGAAPGSVPTRWTVLGTALDQFEALWEQAAEANIVSDRIGLVHFNHTTAPADFGGGSIFKRRDGTILAGDSHAWDEVLDAAKAPTPGGSTGIGAGLNLAFEKILEDPANLDAVIVLMSDGEQNVAPLIQKVAGTDNWALRSTAPLTDPPTAGADELHLKAIPIQTIAMGSPAASFAQLLDGIAAQTAGTAIVTTTDTGMSAAMQDVLLAALKGNTLGLLARTQGTLQPHSLISAPVAIQLDASVRRATAVLSWSGQPGTFDLVFLPPGGGNPVPPSLRKEGANWVVASVDLPASGPSGLWQLAVRGRDTSASGSFQLSAYALDMRLKYSLSFGSARNGTGTELPLSLDLSYDGTPLAGIPGGIRVWPARPGEGLGNILNAAAGDPPGPGTDGSSLMSKIDALSRDAKLLDRVAAKPGGDTLELADGGINGDARAGDGIYTARVPDTRVPGRYRMDVVLEWDDPRTGRVSRIESVEREVEVVPDPQRSTVDISAGAAAGSYVIQVTPRDRFGNHMGPGYAGRVAVRLNGSGTVGAATDPQLTGVYRLAVGNTNATSYTLVVDNVAVRTDAPLVPGTSGGGGRHAAWLALGRTFPRASFSNTHDGGFAGTLGFEWTMSPTRSIEATIGLHRFDGKGVTPETEVTQLGIGGKWSLAPSGVVPFVTAGVGAYVFDPGSTRLGVNVGAGLRLDVAPQWSVEARYAEHLISGNSPRSRYSTLQLGLRLAF